MAVETGRLQHRLRDVVEEHAPEDGQGNPPTPLLPCCHRNLPSYYCESHVHMTLDSRKIRKMQLYCDRSKRHCFAAPNLN